mmetsp:Transcript_21593/g.30942  ORF Transcript_21593/g.30942 Transcript_21593/m.30942 type:complete len:240 (+) Transcript_21593:2155-2874(+)
MMIAAKIDDKLVIRAYTPISSDRDLGYFDLVVKIYHSTAAATATTAAAIPLSEGDVKVHHKQGGKMSQFLGSLRVGDSIDVKGPIGHVIYSGPGELSLHGQPHAVSHFSMLCAGSGITPIFQFLRAILDNSALDKTPITLLFANRYEEDILLRSELDAFARDHPGQLTLHYLLSRPLETWKHFRGHVTKPLIKEILPAIGNGGKVGKFALLCGPPGFIDEACIPALLAHGFEPEHIVQF